MPLRTFTYVVFFFLWKFEGRSWQQKLRQEAAAMMEKTMCTVGRLNTPILMFVSLKNNRPIFKMPSRRVSWVYYSKSPISKSTTYRHFICSKRFTSVVFDSIMYARVFYYVIYVIIIRKFKIWSKSTNLKSLSLEANVMSGVDYTIALHIKKRRKLFWVL